MDTEVGSLGVPLGLDRCASTSAFDKTGTSHEIKAIQHVPAAGTMIMAAQTISGPQCPKNVSLFPDMKVGFGERVQTACSASGPRGILAGVLLWMLTGFTGFAQDTGLEFFENKVRPLLIAHCYECHSLDAEKLRGGLLLDSAPGWQRGGTTGPAIVPGNPEESLLLQAVRGTASDIDRMPPAKAGREELTPEEIQVLETWIQMGAPDPRTGAEHQEAVAAMDPANHWAFQPPARLDPPSTQNTDWAKTTVDKWILARLEQEGLTPAPATTRATWLRRASLDVTGLPPTPEEMKAFLKDPDPDDMAYERVVNRLLASPHYGERWGRHWLDVARYADSKGYVFEEERRYPFSYTYRDWVVASLNEDLPYDQFLIAQIAGDHLATEEDPSPMAGLGFLTLGRRFLNNQHDIIDDRLDVVFRGTQALTVQCARCHDHKYDPIPIEDYYSLYGVFASSEEPAVKPLLGDNPDQEAAAAYEKEHAKRVQEREDFRRTKTEETLARLRSQVGDHLLCAQESLGGDGDALEKLARERKLDPGLVRIWQQQLTEWAKVEHPPAPFAAWVAFAELDNDTFASKAENVLSRLKEKVGAVSPLILQALEAIDPLTSLADVAQCYNDVFKGVDAAWQELLAEGSAADNADLPDNRVVQLEDTDSEALRQVLYGPNSPITQIQDQVRRFFDVPTAQRLRALQRQVEELEATHPGAPPRAMALLDKSSPVEPVVFRRGNPGNRGDRVPRQFLSMLETEPKPFEKGSGRYELALAIASRDNPLTARVLVNRVWLQYFGIPLVDTPSDFGLRSEPPSHPELLDSLAWFLMDSGWSLKALHREILLSATYRMASDPHADASLPEQVRAGMLANHHIDPQNSQYWRMNRKRLDFEGLRDSLLAVSGTLVPKVGGRPVEIYSDNPALRRTLYGFIDRQNLPGLLRAFDFASPDSTSPMRFQTTVPQQALFMINSRFVQERARDFARRTEHPSKTDADRITALYEWAFQRPPTAQERELAFTFLVQQRRVTPLLPTATDWQYGVATLDGTATNVLRWTPFTVFKDARWQTHAEYPAEDAPRYSALTARGGHPGPDAAHAVSRRWTAPLSGVITIRGELHHPGKGGDGVRAQILSQKQGVLGSWTAHHARVPTPVESVQVEKGETLDFVVDCLESDDTDGFEWAPVLELVQPGEPSVAQPGRTWAATSDFRGPTAEITPMDAWDKLAQVLLASNEFAFVD